VISIGLNVQYSYLYRKYINHIHLFTFFIYSPSPISALSLAWPVLHSCDSLFRCLFAVSWGIYLGILAINILCLSQSKPFPLHFCFLSSCKVSFLILVYFDTFWVEFSLGTGWSIRVQFLSSACDYPLFQEWFIKKSLFSNMLLAPLSRIRIVYFGSSILFHWSMCQAFFVWL
jgi:hypothetical protein